MLGLVELDVVGQSDVECGGWVGSVQVEGGK